VDIYIKYGNIDFAISKVSSLNICEEDKTSCVLRFSFHTTYKNIKIMIIDFNAALLEINAAVMKRYPEACFFEAQGYLTESVDGQVKGESVKVAYGLPEKKETLIGTLDQEGKPKIKRVSDIWCEDIVTTPYVPLTAQEAIEILSSGFCGDVIKPCPITLRHMLYPGEIEPKYFIGTFMDCHTVGVYSRQIDLRFDIGMANRTITL